MRNRRGFTRTELIVVLVVIGALSAVPLSMVAREALISRQMARANAVPDTKCIARVKEIAAAIRMYTADYGALWPAASEQSLQQDSSPDPGSAFDAYYPRSRAPAAGSYLRPAVVLDRYLKDRDTWRCPRASMENRAVWSGLLKRTPDDRGPQGTPGESGAHDSVPEWFLRRPEQEHVLVDAPESHPGMFRQSIATNAHLAGLKLSRVHDPGKYLACGDSGLFFEVRDIVSIAFPDMCAVQACGYVGGDSAICPDACNYADWEECPFTQTCGLSPEAHAKLLTDKQYRKTFTRHSGGSNVGFLDGHAKWYSSDYLLTHSNPFKRRALEGELCSCWPGNGKVPKGAGREAQHAQNTKLMQQIHQSLAARKHRAHPQGQPQGRPTGSPPGPSGAQQPQGQ